MTLKDLGAIARICMRVYVYVCIYIKHIIHVCVCVYIYIYTYIHTYTFVQPCYMYVSMFTVLTHYHIRAWYAYSGVSVYVYNYILLCV